MVRRIAIIGFGKIAEFILDAFASADGGKLRDAFEIVAIWNRSVSKLRESTRVRPEWILERLDELPARSPDLIVEVSHPDILRAHGVFFLTLCDVFIGSPTAFAEEGLLTAMTAASRDPAVRGAIYMAAGALWGSEDVAKMGERRAVASASITMKKPAHSMKLEEPLQTALAAYTADPQQLGECVLYDGPVRELCALAPNNVNTMACFAIATQLGFDAVVGRLVADKALAAHVVIAEVWGKPTPGRDDVFHVKSERYNPCNPNEVTGIQTYASFVASLQRSATQRGKGLHFV